MKIIVGLGNPGSEYENTRHNIGFMFLDFLANRHSFSINKKFKSSIIGETILGNNKIVFAKPQTYMNLSGKAVVELKNWYKVDDKDILIVYDDMDIQFGDTRFKEKGSGGTHNGMKNIIQMLSSNDVPRLKIGTGGIKPDTQDTITFVLSKFTKDEMNKIEEIFYNAEEKIKIFLDI